MMNTRLETVAIVSDRIALPTVGYYAAGWMAHPKSEPDDVRGFADALFHDGKQMAVMSEEDHLCLSGQLGQRFEARGGTGVVEVDEKIIDDEGQGATLI